MNASVAAVEVAVDLAQEHTKERDQNADADQGPER